MTVLFDIGVNLTSSAFDQRHHDVLERARQASVTQLLLIGSDIADSRQAIELCQQYPGCYATAGIHPHQAKTLDNASIGTIRQLASCPQVKAIGETGLDFNRNYSTPAQQIRCFEAQLELAAELQLPVYLHQRDAHQAFYERLKDYRNSLCDAVIHCFTGNEQELEAYLELDLHIGITGWICDERRGLHLQELVKKIPEHRLMLETDAPYLLPRTLRPKPKKGKNEPCYLPHILTTVSRCVNKSEQTLAATTTANAARFFRLKNK
jgi:TatD DNase family protein